MFWYSTLISFKSEHLFAIIFLILSPEKNLNTESNTYGSY
jgi:hypothetical protein